MSTDRVKFRDDNLSAQERDHANLFLQNYYGETDVSKWAESFVNEGVHDGEFIPWTVMTTALKLLDWKSKIEVLENDDGGYVFRDTVMTQTSQREVEGVSANSGTEIVRSTETDNTTYSFYVKIRITYLDDVTDHMYAIMDTAHRPVQYINSQLVNKAIQRAKARSISLVTGIGLTLWTREAVQEEVTIDREDAPQKLEPKKKEVKKEKLTKPNENGTIGTPGEKTIEVELAELLVAKTKEPEFIEEFKTSLNFIRDTFGVDYLDDNVVSLAESLKKVNDLEGFAKMIMKGA